MADAKVWDSNQVTVAFSGIPIDSGRGEGDGPFLSIERDTKAFTDTVTSDGEVVRSKTNDKRATAKLTLMNTSKSNALLSALALLDENTANGAGIGAFTVTDLNGTSLYFSAKAWISGTPKIDIGGKPQPLEWEIRLAKLEPFTSGV